MKYQSLVMLIISTFLVILGLSSCSNPTAEGPTQVELGLEELQTAAIETFFTDLTRQAPTITETPSSTATPTMTPSVTVTTTPADTPTPVPVSELMKTYIAYYVTFPVETVTECKYYVKPFIAYPYVIRTGNYETDITNALAILFSIKEPSIGGFENYISASNIELTGFARSGSTLNVYFDGIEFLYGNEGGCKDRQARDQIYRTIGQFDDMLSSDAIRIYDIVMWMGRELLDDLYLHDMNINTNP
jgi:hypothetical protein